MATFYLSTDTKQSSDDKALGTAGVGKLKPKKFKQVSGIFAVPASVTTGTYHVVVCADTGRAVKERKESNNCKGSKGTVAVTATGPPKQVTISYAVSPVQLPLVGSVSGSATNGTCTNDPVTGGGSCVVTAGVGTVTLTATPLLPVPVPELDRRRLHQRQPTRWCSPARARTSPARRTSHLTRQDCPSYDASSSSTVRTRPRAARLSALR